MQSRAFPRSRLLFSILSSRDGKPFFLFTTRSRSSSFREWTFFLVPEPFKHLSQAFGTGQSPSLQPIRIPDFCHIFSEVPLPDRFPLVWSSPLSPPLKQVKTFHFISLRHQLRSLGYKMSDPSALCANNQRSVPSTSFFALVFLSLTSRFFFVNFDRPAISGRRPRQPPFPRRKLESLKFLPTDRGNLPTHKRRFLKVRQVTFLQR